MASFLLYDVSMKNSFTSIQLGLIAIMLLAFPCLVRAEESITVVPPSSPTLTLRSSETPPLLGGTTLSSGVTNNLFSEPPSLAGQYRVHGAKVMPYIGLGFTGGETTDVNRTVTRESALRSALQQDRLMTDSLGKTLVPNEVQLGVRIPF